MATKDINNNKEKSKNLLGRVFAFFKKLSRKKKIALLILIVGLLVWRFFIYGNGGLEVDTTEVKKGDLTQTVTASGEVIADNSAVLSFETSGELAEINVEKGDSVSKGDVLAKLETTRLFASYQKADASLRNAQATLDRVYDDIKEEGEDFDEIETRTAAETAKDAAYWDFVIAQRNLAGAYVKAPFDGIVTQVPADLEPGSDIISPASHTFKVVGPETIQFEAEVNEVDVNRLFSNADAIIELDAYPEETFEEKIVSINFTSITTSTGGTAYEVRTTFPQNENLKFRPGMNGDVEFVIGRKEDVLLVPISAVVEDGGTFVWVVEDGTTRKAEVETGVSSIDEIEIISGLSEGQEIIVRPPSDIEEGVETKAS